MRRFPPEPKTLRQVVLAGLAGFIIGFVGLLAIWAWVVYRYRPPEGGWWGTFQLLHMSIHIIIFAVIVGLLVALVAVRFTEWLQYRLGMHHCHLCGRVLRAERIPCECVRTQPLTGANAG